MYTAQVLDHFEHPRNPGVLEKPDAVAQVENPICGDVLKLTVKVSEGKLERVRFQAKGCVPAMACGSAITELATGKTPNAASEISSEELVALLGGLPPASTHASQLAIDALKAILKQLGAASGP